MSAKLTTTPEQVYVLVVDVCSSTAIMEDLLTSDNLERWAKLLLKMQAFLEKESGGRRFAIYKFVGDGWILLFDIDFPPAELFALLNRLCIEYNTEFKREIRGVLSTEVDPIGINFGFEKGHLMQMEMNGKLEFIGRAINIAARLQGAIKPDPEPQGKMLMSKPVYERVHSYIKEYRTVSVKRTLHNVSRGDKYRPVKATIWEPPHLSGDRRK